jgi:hypothetical protein
MKRLGRPPNIPRQQAMLRMRAKGMTYKAIGEALDPPAAMETVATFFRRLRLAEESAKKETPGR